MRSAVSRVSLLCCSNAMLASFVCRPTADAGVRFRQSIPVGCGTDTRGKVMRASFTAGTTAARAAALQNYSALPQDAARPFCYCPPLCGGDAHASARVHHPTRQRGGRVAVGGEGTAGDDPDDRLPQQLVPGSLWTPFG